jgi:hypothetical protein
MNKTKLIHCPKCKKKMDTQRSDAKQCRCCRRKQQNASSHRIKKEERALLKSEKIRKVFQEPLEKFNKYSKNNKLRKKLNNPLLYLSYEENKRKNSIEFSKDYCWFEELHLNIEKQKLKNLLNLDKNLDAFKELISEEKV